MVYRLYPRILRPPAKSFFLFGPRGCGKSTWARRGYPRALTFDLLDEGLYQALLADPTLFGRRLRTLRRGAWVWVDEVQRLPWILNEVHRFIEERGLRFVLSGSSSRKLTRAGVNLLAGRALRLTMYPFLPAELGDDFDLEKVLESGSLPIVWTSSSRAATLAAYAQTYLKEEIQGEALVRNLPGFARFLPVAALFHGQVLNSAAVARDAGVARTTVEGFLSILEETYMAFRLRAFEGRLRVREKRHPKLYWIDPGLVRAAKKQLGAVTAEERGALLEGFVAMVLQAYGETRSTFEEMFYWAPADADRTEVDFLLGRGRRFLAIEVKSGRRVSSGDLKGLRAIAPLAGLARRLLVSPSATPGKTEDGIEIWNTTMLFDALENGTLWPRNRESGAR